MMSRLIYIFVMIYCIFPSGADVAQSIAQTINDYIKDLSNEEITEKIEFHYKLLGLIDNNGEWVHYYFNTYPNGFNLFPR